MATNRETSPLLGQSSGSQPATYTVPASPSSVPAFTILSAAERKSQLLGCFYMVLSVVCFSTMSLLVSISSQSLPSFELVFFRGIAQTALGLGACYILGVSPIGTKGVRFLLFCRGLAGSLGLAFFFFALSKMPLADATVIFFLGPTFTGILARIVLKEAFTPLDGFASLVTLTGVCLVAKPTFLFPTTDGDFVGMTAAQIMDLETDRYNRFQGTIAGFLGAMCSAVAYVIVRKLGKAGAHSMQHVVYFGVVSIVVSIIGLQTMQGGYQTPPTPSAWVMVWTLGTIAFFGQILLNNGLQMAPLALGTSLRLNDIVFAYIWQITILKETPDVLSFVGAGMVMACTGGVTYYRWRVQKNRAEAEALRKRLAGEQEEQDEEA